MNKALAPLAITALLMTGCAGTVEAEPEPSATTTPSTTPTPEPTTEEPTPGPEPTTEESAPEPTTMSDEKFTEVFTQPEVETVDAFTSEASFLATYKEQLQTLPDGPYAQLGSDLEAIDLGWYACYDLEVMSYGEALMYYAFTDGVTEEQVADYNAALNAAPGTLC